MKDINLLKPKEVQFCIYTPGGICVYDGKRSSIIPSLPAEKQRKNPIVYYNFSYGNDINWEFIHILN